jgi:hypothetical protein
MHLKQALSFLFEEFVLDFLAISYRGLQNETYTTTVQSSSCIDQRVAGTGREGDQQGANHSLLVYRRIHI